MSSDDLVADPWVALVEAVLPLEVIAAQDRAKPYIELSRAFIEDINAAIAIVRAALAAKPEPGLDVERLVEAFHAFTCSKRGHAAEYDRPYVEAVAALYAATAPQEPE